MGCLILCEVYKLNVKRQIDAYQAGVIKKEQELQEAREKERIRRNSVRDKNGHSTNGDKNGHDPTNSKEDTPKLLGSGVTVETQRSNGYTMKEKDLWTSVTDPSPPLRL